MSGPITYSIITVSCAGNLQGGPASVKLKPFLFLGVRTTGIRSRHRVERQSATFYPGKNCQHRRPYLGQALPGRLGAPPLHGGQKQLGLRQHCLDRWLGLAQPLAVDGKMWSAKDSSRGGILVHYLSSVPSTEESVWVTELWERVEWVVHVLTSSESKPGWVFVFIKLVCTAKRDHAAGTGGGA